MNKNFYTQPKNILHFETQAENEIRTDLQQKIIINMIGIRENTITEDITNV